MKGKQNLKRLINRCGEEQVLRALFALEAGTKKSAVASDLGISNSYLSQVLSEIPTITLFRIPSELLNCSDTGATDSGGTVRSQRFVSDAARFAKAYGLPCSNPSKLAHELFDTADIPEENHDKLLLNTVTRAMCYIAAQESAIYGQLEPEETPIYTEE